jgi:putative ABC transport system ATP-binding protein
MDANAQPLIRLNGVRKLFHTEEVTTHAVSNINLEIRAGEFVSIAGPSGCGKSTLLSILGLLDTPTEGEYLFEGTPVESLSSVERASIRNRKIGFIFQSFNLIGSLTAEQNVAMPLRLAGQRPSRGQVRSVLAEVGLADRLRHRPRELSGGQQQRVAIARAMVTRPAVLFADEPTGALDTRSARTVLGLLRSMVDTAGQTVVMVTHDPVTAASADRVLFLSDGRLVDRLDSPTTRTVADKLAYWEESSS